MRYPEIGYETIASSTGCNEHVILLSFFFINFKHNVREPTTNFAPDRTPFVQPDLSTV